MVTKDEFQLFLYKNKLNNIELVDIVDILSSKTLKNLMDDLQIKIQKKEHNVDTLYIFTDGCCKNNGKKNPRGSYGVFFTDDIQSELYKFNCVEVLADEPTNQKAELLAINKLCSIINNNIELFTKRLKLVIVTDSIYSIKCIQDWSKGWLKNNWKTSKGEPVKNASIIKNILSLIEILKSRDLSIEFRHVYSHLQEPKEKDSLEYFLWYGNNRVDKMISKELESQKNE